MSYANSVAYNASLHSYWSVQEKEVSPYCIVSPANSRDVSTAVKILSTGRPSTVCKFAIRSGGHTAHAGSANINDGVTIDLSALDEITLSADQSTVAIGPGQRWRNVYGALQARNLSVSGGRAGGVGVGGLTLGGQLLFLLDVQPPRSSRSFTEQYRKKAAFPTSPPGKDSPVTV